MQVWIETCYGPQKCEVVREVCPEYVVLKGVGKPAGPFGVLAHPWSGVEFVYSKKLCWKRSKRANKYATKHWLIGRPTWKIKADLGGKGNVL